VIIIGSLVVLAIFLVMGWAVATEMFQQRAWRRRVDEGDAPLVSALIEEAHGTWRRSRPPRGTPASLWAGVQGAQLVAVTEDSATFSASAEGEFRTEAGKRVQVSTALDEAIALASRLIDMMLYDVPNLRLRRVRVDAYTTFSGGGGHPEQRPILTVTADRSVADSLSWEALTPAEVLGRFDARYHRDDSGQGEPIELDAIEGIPPAQPREPENTGREPEQ
jgi:hypothetical protein